MDHSFKWKSHDFSKKYMRKYLRSKTVKIIYRLFNLKNTYHKIKIDKLFFLKRKTYTL